MAIAIINGVEMELGPTECKDVYPCPDCGKDLIVNYGPGISITFCPVCGYSFTDYD